RIDPGEPTRRVDPEARKRIDPFVEMDQSQASERGQTDGRTGHGEGHDGRELKTPGGLSGGGHHHSATGDLGEPPVSTQVRECIALRPEPPTHSIWEREGFHVKPAARLT